MAKGGPGHGLNLTNSEVNDFSSSCNRGSCRLARELTYVEGFTWSSNGTVVVCFEQCSAWC